VLTFTVLVFFLLGLPLCSAVHFNNSKFIFAFYLHLQAGIYWIVMLVSVCIFLNNFGEMEKWHFIKNNDFSEQQKIK
jgi:hypothetical protein